MNNSIKAFAAKLKLFFNRIGRMTSVILKTVKYLKIKHIRYVQHIVL